MRKARDFNETMRGGVRVSRPCLIVYVKNSLRDESALVGFTVGRAIGGSVVRHRVVRQLRVGADEIVDEIPRGTRVVVRALPAVTELSGREMQGEVKKALREGLGKLRTR